MSRQLNSDSGLVGIIFLILLGLIAGASLAIFAIIFRQISTAKSFIQSVRAQEKIDLGLVEKFEGAQKNYWDNPAQNSGQNLSFGADYEYVIKKNGPKRDGPELLILRGESPSRVTDISDGLILRRPNIIANIIDWAKLIKDFDGDDGCRKWEVTDGVVLKENKFISVNTCTDFHGLTTSSVVHGNIEVQEPLTIEVANSSALSSGRLYFVVLGSLTASSVILKNINNLQVSIIAAGSIEIETLELESSSGLEVLVYSAGGIAKLVNNPIALSICAEDLADQQYDQAGLLSLEAGSGIIIGERNLLEERAFGCVLEKENKYWPPVKMLGRVTH